MYNSFQRGFKGVVKAAAACFLATAQSLTVLLESTSTIILIINSVAVEKVQH